MSYLSQIERHAKAVPSPSAYDIKVESKARLGKIDASSRTSFLTEAEHLAQKGPSPVSHKEQAKMFTLPKVKSCTFSPVRKNEQRGWKVAKKDGPAPGSYNTDRALTLTKNSSVGWKMGTQKREGISRGKKNATPGPNAYGSVGFEKVYKRTTFRGRY